MGKLVYIAGPYRASTPYGVERNIRAAEAFIMPVAKAGAVAVVPHMMFRGHDGALPDEWFLGATLEVMRRCDAVLMMPRWESSAGATKERHEALANGIPVLETMHDLRAWIGGRHA